MIKLTSDMEPNKERQESGGHAFGRGVGFYGEGTRTYEQAKKVIYPAEPYGSNPFKFARVINSLPTPEQDWRMVEDPNNPGVYRERVMLSGRGPNAKILNGK